MKHNKVKVADLAIGLFCFMLFFVINPNGLVPLTSAYKVFFLNTFLFAPYIVLAHSIAKNAMGVKKLPAIAATAILATELIVLQVKIVTGGEVQLDPAGDLMATLNLVVFLLFLTEILTRKMHGGRK